MTSGPSEGVPDEVLELARNLYPGEAVASAICQDGPRIAEALAGNWPCYSAALRRTAVKRTQPTNLLGYLFTLAKDYAKNGIPAEPVSARPKPPAAAPAPQAETFKPAAPIDLTDPESERAWLIAKCTGRGYDPLRPMSWVRLAEKHPADYLKLQAAQSQIDLSDPAAERAWLVEKSKLPKDDTLGKAARKQLAEKYPEALAGNEASESQIKG